MMRRFGLFAIVAACASCASGAKPGAAPVADGPVYSDAQVSKPVVALQGSSGPQYPLLLKNNHVEGMVMLAFIVDTTGRAEIASINVIKSTDPLFLNSVVVALKETRFSPAVLYGQKVRQVVAQPYYFGMTDSTKAHGPQTTDQAVKTLIGTMTGSSGTAVIRP